MNPLYPHQMQAVAAAMQALPVYGGFYVAHGVGAMKTLTSITIARLLQAKRVLVVVGPVSALGVWRLELAKWWPEVTEFGNGMDPDDTMIRVRGVNRLVDRGLSEAEKKAGKPPRRTGEQMIRDLIKWQPDLLIFDESQVLSNVSKQTAVVTKLRAACKYVVLLSGTPVHDIRGYRTQYRLIEPTNPLWSMTKAEYEKEVCVFKGPDKNWFDKPKPGATERISKMVAPYTHWFDTHDLKLPEPIFTQVPVTLHEEERRAYDQMDKDFRAEIARGGVDVSELHITTASTAMVKAMRLHQLACGHATDESGSDVFARRSSKLDTLLELLRERAHLKVIVVARFTAEVDRIMEEAQKFWPRGPGQQSNVMRIDGRDKADQRDAVVAAFQSHTVPKLIVMQPKSGGISTTLTAADCMIFYSFEPSHIVWQQTVGRVYRMSQTTHVQILSLVAENTVDERLYSGLMQGLEDNDLAKYVVGDDRGATP